MSEHATEPSSDTNPSSSDAPVPSEPLPTTPDPALVNVTERGIPPRQRRGPDD